MSTANCQLLSYSLPGSMQSWPSVPAARYACQTRRGRTCFSNGSGVAYRAAMSPEASVSPALSMGPVLLACSRFAPLLLKLLSCWLSSSPSSGVTGLLSLLGEGEREKVTNLLLLVWLCSLRAECRGMMTVLASRLKAAWWCSCSSEEAWRGASLADRCCVGCGPCCCCCCAGPSPSTASSPLTRLPPVPVVALAAGTGGADAATAAAAASRSHGL
jgi:hypothetical protein